MHNRRHSGFPCCKQVGPAGLCILVELPAIDDVLIQTEEVAQPSRIAPSNDSLRHDMAAALNTLRDSGHGQLGAR